MYKKTLMFLLLCCLLCFESSANPKDIQFNDSKTSWSFEGDYLSLRYNNRDYVLYEFEPGFEPGFSFIYSINTSKTKSFFLSSINYRYKTTGSAAGDWVSSLGSQMATIAHEYHQGLNIVTLALNESLPLKKKMVLNYFGGIQYLNITNSILYRWAYNGIQASGSVYDASVVHGMGGTIGLNFLYQYSSHVGINIQSTYSTIYLFKNSKINEQVFIDRVTVPNITSNTSLKLNNDTVIGGQDADASIYYAKKISQGLLSIKIGWHGIAYGKFGDRWEGRYLGLVWTE